MYKRNWRDWNTLILPFRELVISLSSAIYLHDESLQDTLVDKCPRWSIVSNTTPLVWKLWDGLSHI